MRNKAKQYYIYTIILVIVVLISFLLYKQGYRFTDKFWIGKIGKLEMNLPQENVSIIIDKKIKINSTKNSESIDLAPKTHEIIISKEGYYPWTKKIKIQSGKTLSITPFFISQNATGQIVTVNDPEYWKIKGQVEKDVLPSKDKPLTSPDGSIIWVENNAVLIKTNGQIHTVIEPDTIINNLSLYKDRSDVIIFSTYNGIYAIETDTSDIQNFMPIYKGTEPHFIVSNQNTLYVLDKELLMEVVI